LLIIKKWNDLARSAGKAMFQTYLLQMCGTEMVAPKQLLEPIKSLEARTKGEVIQLTIQLHILRGFPQNTINNCG
jgi:hypothetical protein